MYIVEYKGNYLKKGYWKGIKGHTTQFMSEAYRFSMFELKLLVKIILRNKKDYKIYYVEE